MGEILVATEAGIRLMVGIIGMGIAFFMENRIVAVATFAFGAGAVAHALVTG